MLVLGLGNLAHCRDGVFASKADQTHPLGGPAHHTQFIHGQADGDARLVDDHQVVLVRHVQDGDELSGLLGDLQGLHPLSSTVGDAVVVHRRALSVAVLRHDKDVAGRILNAHHSDHLVLAVCKRHTAHAHGGASHGTRLGFVESDGLA